MATYMEWFETLDLWSLHEHLLHALPRHCCHCPTWHHHGRCTAKLEASWVERKQLSAIRPSMQQLINVANPMVIPSGYDWQQPSKVFGYASYHRNWVPDMTYSGFSLLMELSEGSPFRSFMRLEKSWRVKWIAGLGSGKKWQKLTAWTIGFAHVFLLLQTSGLPEKSWYCSNKKRCQTKNAKHPADCHQKGYIMAYPQKKKQQFTPAWTCMLHWVSLARSCDTWFGPWCGHSSGIVIVCLSSNNFQFAFLHILGTCRKWVWRVALTFEIQRPPGFQRCIGTRCVFGKRKTYILQSPASLRCTWTN